jgi:8-hydroxy-5-deazaflavin:NADPH oxidoreductase
LIDRKPVLAVLGGTGSEGSGLSLRWARAGYPVILGSRNPEKAQGVCDELNALVGGNGISHMDNRGAAAAGEIVVLTVPFSAQQATVQAVRAELQGKILVDTTVPLVPPKVARVQLPVGGSAVAAVQAVLGESVKVVSAFQNVAAHQLRDLEHDADCDVLVCGDDAAAREIVVDLAKAIGLRGIHAGPIGNSVAAEALTSILIFINSRYKVAHGSGIRIVGPELGE